MNEDIRREIEDRIYGHDSIGYQLLNEFLSEEQFQELARETFRKFADVLEKNGILALEAIDRRLDSIIERVTAECSRADTEINELARNAGNIALLEYWKSEWRPKRDQIETSMISYAEKIETLASHRS